VTQTWVHSLSIKLVLQAAEFQGHFFIRLVQPSAHGIS